MAFVSDGKKEASPESHLDLRWSEWYGGRYVFFLKELWTFPRYFTHMPNINQAGFESLYLTKSIW